MNLKTTLKMTALSAGVGILGASFLMQPHKIAYASAHAYAFPANLNEAARDSFVKVQMKADSIAEAKVLKEHFDTCTWCKTSKVINKPMNAFCDLVLKLVKK